MAMKIGQIVQCYAKGLNKPEIKTKIFGAWELFAYLCPDFSRPPAPQG